MGQVAYPPFAYVPGQTARHDEAAFDELRATARSDMDPVDLAGCTAMQAGMTYLDGGFFWEAHEVLEPVWMACPPNSKERSVVQAAIQLANARLKRVMGKLHAEKRLVEMARVHLGEAGDGGAFGGFVAGLQGKIDSRVG